MKLNKTPPQQTIKELENLNKEQQEAVLHEEGALLILAGAGSGKTKTLISRLSHLINSSVDPRSCLLLTFSNKAAREMKERYELMLSNVVTVEPKITTFHSFGLGFLRSNINRLNGKYESNFIVHDSDDTGRVIKNNANLRSLNKTVISDIKNNIFNHDQIVKKHGETIAKSYALYQHYLECNNSLDFDDLLLLTYELLSNDRRLREWTSNKYQHIMVDEYQDTNVLQYKILKLLTGKHNNICVVGDDDQSIYAFRGAKIENILNFEKEFKAKIIRLVKNYRSKQIILDAANSLIQNNSKRLGKELISANLNNNSREYKGTVEVIKTKNDNDEKEIIKAKLKQLQRMNIPLSEIAFLYRLNALSTYVERLIKEAKIPYKIVSSIGFYERAEIRDAFAFIRLCNNINNIDTFRIFPKMSKGVGKVTQNKLNDFVTAKEVNLFICRKQYNEEMKRQFKEHILVQIDDFFIKINQLKALINNKHKGSNLIDLEEELKKLTTLIISFYKDNQRDREHHLNNFFNDFIAFLRESTLEDFIDQISLNDDYGGEKIDDGVVSLMTIHASKGLEFKHVFIIGCENNILPFSRGDMEHEHEDEIEYEITLKEESRQIPSEGNKNSGFLEEERRLAYVAFTRAKEGLYLCSSSLRYIYNKRHENRQSIFIKDANLDCQNTVKERAPLFQKNEAVHHRIFGYGIILTVEEGTLIINFGGTERRVPTQFINKII